MRAWPSAGLPDTRSAPRRVRGRKRYTVPERLAVGMTPPQNGFS